MHHSSRRTSLRRLGTALAALVALVSLSGCVPLPTSGHGATSIPGQNPAAEKQLLASVNGLRAAHHERALALHTNLVQKARYWALWMAAGNCGRTSSGAFAICHSSLAGGIHVHWTILEENVGAASPRTNVAGVAHAFAVSKPHLANILNPKITYVGIGVAYHGNTIFVAEEFMAT